MNNKISIFFSADENYARYCAVTILSILKNSSSPENLEFYILSPDISQQNTQKIQQICTQFDAKVSIIPIDLSLFNSLPIVQEHLNLNVYSRLCGADILRQCDRIIYLDCDLIVLGDIVELFNTELEKKPIAATPHVQFPYQDIFRQNFDVEGEDIYFNGGVILIDSIHWRKNRYGELTLTWATKNANKLHYNDQDALNVVFWKNYCHLPGVWNVEARLYKEKLLGLPQNEEITKRMQNPKIIHYTGADKPWASKKYVPMRHLYTYYSKQLSQSFSWYPSKHEPKQCTISSLLNFAWSCLYFRTSYNINKIFYNQNL
ncbi:glycosyltransferase family 8 protein [Anabaena sp. CCY 9402-a]|uniref:glycosyltransferase family 8 protein n=1 Tax=Anabaena sp. CCY 9402-a TaxID=3103867 RepID=UPI0039C60C97